MVSLEAIACGRPVIMFVSSEYLEYKDFPLKDVNTEEEVASAISDVSVKLWEREYAYLEQNHKDERIVERLLKLYNRM